MSKIGKKLISIPDGVEVKIADGRLEVKGKLGALSLLILDKITAELKDKTLVFSASGEGKQARANWGTMRALAQNAVIGVSEGYVKYLELEGIGFKASLEGKTLVLNIGFTHPVKFTPPEGIALAIEKSSIKISGIDKAMVGEVAAQIRELRKPEPYKGTGIKYRGEVIARKEGKKAASAGAAGA